MLKLKPYSIIFLSTAFVLFISCKKEIASNTDRKASIKYFNGGQNDKVNQVERTQDGGFIYCGYTLTGESNTQAFMLKVNKNGQQEWYKTYGADKFDKFNHAIQCSDNGFIAVGTTTMKDVAAFDMDYVVKTDGNGNLEWSKSFTEGTYSLCALTAVTESNDHTIYATGYYPSNTVFMDVMVLKFDLNGNQSAYENIPADPAYQPNTLKDVSWAGGMGISVNKNNDIVMGVSLRTSFAANNALLSMKPDGKTVNFYFPYFDQPFGASYSSTSNDGSAIKVLCADDAYYIAYYRDSTDISGLREVVQLMKTDLNGNKLWNKSYAGLRNAIIFDLYQESDGSVLMAGCSSQFSFNSSFPENFYAAKPMVLKVDAAGNIIKTEYINIDANINILKSIRPSDRGGVLVAGYTSLNSNAYHKMFITELNSDFTIKQ